jgi:hypothetical protein
MGGAPSGEQTGVRREPRRAPRKMTVFETPTVREDGPVLHVDSRHRS